MDCRDVEKFEKGYANSMRSKGYRPQSAAPWAPGDVTKVVHHLAAMVQNEEGLARVLAARDLFCLTVQWQCVSRGITAVEWSLGDITLGSGRELYICVARAS